MERKKISDDAINIIMEKFKESLKDRINQKSSNGFASSHEIVGVINEEFAEFKTAVHDNNTIKQYNELFDILISAFWGIASMQEDTLDW